MQQMRVLVVDDSWADLTFMARALQASGYEVTTASDGDEAIAKALAERPDCIVLDVVLPHHSGFAVCRHLKQQPATAQIPIILVSVKDTPLDQRWGMQQGANAYLTKPFDPAELVAQVQRVVLG